jgi:hypothetical protein
VAVLLPQPTAEHYRRQQQLTLATVAATRRVWSQVEGLDSSWPTLGARLTVLLTAAQLAAARSSAEYVPEVLASLGVTAEPVAAVSAGAFAGAASDGRPLDTLLYGAVTTAKRAVGRGVPNRDALAAGGRFLDLAVQTQVADAERAATGVQIAVRPDVGGWVRMVNLPSCSRCVVLAGRFYKWNRGFLRHPACDCRHIPATEAVADDLRLNPRRIVKQGQVTGLSEADRRAITEDGADVGQVINARRGMETASVYGRRLKVTNEGVTRRGVAGRVMNEQGDSYQQTPRLRPEAIYQIAGDDRDEAIRLLRRFGYVN